MAEKTLLDSLATVLTMALYLNKDERKKPTVRRTRTARQVLDKHGRVITLYSATETIIESIR